MIWGFILLLALPLAINEFAPEFGKAIVEMLHGGEVVAALYVTVLVIYGFFYFSREKAGKTKADKERREWLLNNIKKTKLITVDGQGSTSVTKSGGVIGRAAVGTLIAGPVGGIIGASTARKRTTTTNEPSKYMFMVYYKDGTRERDTVTEKDWEFEIYMDYIDLGDE